MKKILLGLGALLLPGCSAVGPSDLSVHEVLLYGQPAERLTWVYGTLGASGKSSVSLGGSALELRPQLPGGPAGSLAVAGQNVYRQPLGGAVPRLAVTRTASGLLSAAGNSYEALYYLDGQNWYRLSGQGSLQATPVSGLNGAGQLTDAEAAAISQALRGQGPVAVAVLPTSQVPDAPLKVEPAAREYRRTALYVTSVTAAPASSTGAAVTPPAPGGAMTLTTLARGTNASTEGATVLVATTQAELDRIYRLAYGNQSPKPTAPRLSSGETAVGLFMGRRSTGGYSVEAVSASVSGSTLRLTVQEKSPGKDMLTTQALTSPWSIVKVAGTFRDVQVVNQSGQPFGRGSGGELR
ncbi:protease complex subunit PrcB family protein [Deinococcus lacus]|uniref:Protease complex subunit PrcB family protein n=1 Tax=Deinococcus lacus TaxID=392561 RepID=A0ABW1Y9X6_9DEIO